MGVIVNQTFEAGSVPSGWTGSGSSTWSATTSNPYAGTYSLSGTISGSGVSASINVGTANDGNSGNSTLMFAAMLVSGTGEEADGWINVPSTAGPTTGYRIGYSVSGGLSLYHVLSNSFTQLGSSIGASTAFAVGSWYYITINRAGAVISGAVQRKSDGAYLQSNGSWGSTTFAYCLSVTDGSPLAASAGFAALYTFGTNPVVQFDNVVFQTAATSFSLTGPSAGIENQASANFTVTPNDLYLGTFTPSAATLTGTFAPSSVIFSSTSASQTFTFTPTNLTTGTIGGAGVPVITAPSTVSFTSEAAATSFTLTGPTSGYNHNASTNFTFTPNGGYSGTITPTMNGLAGAWNPTTLTWSLSLAAQTATFTPSAVGSGNANGTPIPSLTAPANAAYSSLAQTFSLSVADLAISASTGVTLTGVGTLWSTSAPTFTPSGVAGVSVGTATVVNNTTATATITTGAAMGTVTFADSTTSATSTANVTTLQTILTAVDFGQGFTGLLGSVGFTVEKFLAGSYSTYQARTVSGIGTLQGSTAATFLANVSNNYVVQWDTGGGSPAYLFDAISSQSIVPPQQTGSPVTLPTMPPAGYGPSTGSGPYTLQVTITDSVTAAPIQNAHVSYSNGATFYSGATNSSGVWSASVTGATWTINIVASGYQAFTPASVAVSGNTSEAYTLVAASIPTPPPGQVTVYGVTTDGVNAVSGITVYYRQISITGTGIAASGQTHTVVSSTAGAFSFAADQNSVYQISLNQTTWLGVTVATSNVPVPNLVQIP
jgi:hypothetical protein